jgi:hypothetical protein
MTAMCVMLRWSWLTGYSHPNISTWGVMHVTYQSFYDRHVLNAQVMTWP